MKQLSTQEIGMVVAQLVLGASESVELMGFKDDPLFSWHSGDTSEEIMALTDERLSARAVLRRIEKVIITYKDLIDPNGRMEEHWNRHWRVRIPPFLPPTHLLLVDNSSGTFHIGNMK
ncbi:MAG: hypothetical protein C4527_07060 [Candidatus Omnitrophota bacterium]|jgi:hypothetical protein|nr:MAG: hypothetical protein C4527_07060 [Candidatus Omnitrophota bacterium]